MYLGERNDVLNIDILKNHIFLEIYIHNFYEKKIFWIFILWKKKEKNKSYLYWVSLKMDLLYQINLN